MLVIFCHLGALHTAYVAFSTTLNRIRHHCRYDGLASILRPCKPTYVRVGKGAYYVVRVRASLKAARS